MRKHCLDTVIFVWIMTWVLAACALEPENDFVNDQGTATPPVEQKTRLESAMTISEMLLCTEGSIDLSLTQCQAILNATNWYKEYQSQVSKMQDWVEYGYVLSAYNTYLELNTTEYARYTDYSRPGVSYVGYYTSRYKHYK